MKVILTIRGWVENDNLKILKKDRITLIKSTDGKHEEFEIVGNMFECALLVELENSKFSIADLNKFIIKYLGNTPCLNYDKTYVDKIEVLKV